MSRTIIIVLLCVCVSSAEEARVRYGFYRDMKPRAGVWGGRRVFGGHAANLEDWPAACALEGPVGHTRCSGTVVAEHWVLTAGHCVEPDVTIVRYNTRQTTASDGDRAEVTGRYRHPEYLVVRRNSEDGDDVTGLHHDVGLVRIDLPMVTPSKPGFVLASLSRYEPADLVGQKLEVYGFGRTETGPQGVQLFGATVKTLGCVRDDWLMCVCGCGMAAGASERGGGGGGGGAGVCAGDSGGPVLFRGVQVAVTSMGPLQCGEALVTGTQPRAVSVFTALAPYATLINDTIMDNEFTEQMVGVTGDAAAFPRLQPVRLNLILVLFHIIPKQIIFGTL